MRLLLTSFLHPRMRDFLGGRVAYVPDAARSLSGAPFVAAEREQVAGYGLDLVDLPLATTPLPEIDRTLQRVDAVYVASGETFDLMHVLRSTGADAILTTHVRAGLPYAASSAGSIIAGPSIEPAQVMDSPHVAPDLADFRGLGLVDRVIVPHAQGSLPPYPISVIAETVARYGEAWPLLLLRDGEALLVEDDRQMLLR